MITMAHNLHILLGDLAEQSVYRFKEYVIKYGKEYKDDKGRTVDNFMRLMLWKDDNLLYEALQSEPDKSVFNPDIDIYTKATLVALKDNINTGGDDLKKQLRFTLKEIFRNTVNVNNPGDDTLHVFIHVPIFIAEAVTRTKLLLDALSETKEQITVDLILINEDLSYLTITDREERIAKTEEFEETAKRSLLELIELRKKNNYGLLQNLILLQNRNENGLSLNLDEVAYANLIGEFALTIASSYHQIYTTTFISAMREKDVLGFGLSMLNFDRYYFVQYLLRRAYKYILDREKVTQSSVDVNKISLEVQERLVNNMHIFTDFYDKEVKPMLIDNEATQNEVTSKIQPKIDEILKGIEQELKSILNDDQLTLPEKKAGLALMFGEDDNLIEGYQYDTDQHILLECYIDFISIFTEANNRLFELPEEAITESGDSIRDYAELSKESGAIVEDITKLIQTIKEKRAEIRTCTNFIRSRNKDIEILTRGVKRAEDSEKLLTTEGFRFGGEVFKVMPANNEQPLKETFVPASLTHLPSQVDLREHFTPIKNQGSLGSCTSFAVVSVCEYLLRRASSKNADINLSELFAYQNARAMMSKERREMGEGTSAYDNITAMGEFGICLEEFHPYVDKNLPEPSEAAKQDALERIVAQAYDVQIDVDHIKAAVAEGYPVVVGLRIFNDLASETGFVPQPTEEQINAPEESGHSMVVCGYSDNERVFIVRNSWGVDFGDRGYLYLPYGYIGDTRLNHSAKIITKINEAEIRVTEGEKKVSVTFNTFNDNVRIAIIQNLISEETIRMNKLKAECEMLIEKYEELTYRKLSNHSKRDTLRKGTEARIDWEIKCLNEKYEEMEIEYGQRVKEYDKDTLGLWIYPSIAVATVLIILSILTFSFDILQFKHWIWGFVGLGILAANYAPLVFSKSSKFVVKAQQSTFDQYKTITLIGWTVGITAITAIYIFFLGFLSAPRNFVDSESGDAAMEIINHYYDLSLEENTVISEADSVTKFTDSIEDIMDKYAVSWLDDKWPMLLLLTSLLYIPYMMALIKRRGIRKGMDEEFNARAQDIINARTNLEIERKTVKLRMYLAGSILDSFTRTTQQLKSQLSNTNFYLNNLRHWRKELDQQEEMVPINSKPFLTLVGNEWLDKFFETSKDSITCDIRLDALLNQIDPDREISEESIIDFENQIKYKLSRELWDSVSDFSIYDYVAGTKTFAYVDNKYCRSLEKLIPDIDTNSLIFIRTQMRASGIDGNYGCKILFRAAPNDEQSRNWSQGSNRLFESGDSIITHDIDSVYKILLIRLEGFNKEEIAMLN